MDEEDGEMDDLTAVLNLIRGISYSGKPAWLVGGAVRDIVLGTLPADWDIVIKTDLEGIKVIFPDAVCVGRNRKPVCHTSFHGLKLEILPLHGEDILSDLAVRDFTINAMAMDFEGELIDPFGGSRDLEKAVLRFTGDASERIEEDPVRILRMCRFASSLKLFIPGSDLIAARKDAHRIRSVHLERVGMEVLKGIKGRCAAFLALVDSSGLTVDLFPFLEKVRYIPASGDNNSETGGNFHHILRMMSFIQKGEYPGEFSPWVLFLPFFSGKKDKKEAARMARDLMVRWGWPLSIREEVIFYAGHICSLFQPLDGKGLYRIYKDMQRRGRVDLFLAARLFLDALPKSTGCFYIPGMNSNRINMKKIFPLLNCKEIFLSCGDISRIFSIPEGPLLGKLRQDLAFSISEGKIKTRDEALVLIEEQIKKTGSRNIKGCWTGF